MEELKRETALLLEINGKMKAHAQLKYHVDSVKEVSNGHTVIWDHRQEHWAVGCMCILKFV